MGTKGACVEAVEAGEVSTGCVAKLGQRGGREGVGMVGRGVSLETREPTEPGSCTCPSLEIVDGLSYLKGSFFS